jgi:predicted ribosomally synthesized peptide with SipW-like signal peptide
MRNRQDARSPRRAVRLAAGLVVPAVALSLAVTGVTLAAYSATETSGQNSMAAATVTLANSAIANCPVSNLLPDGTTISCTFTTTYPGPSPAYLAVDVLVEAQAGSGGTALYNPSDRSHDLDLTVTSSNPTVSYTLPTTATACSAGAPSGSACYQLDNDLVSTSAVTSATVSFTVSVGLPTSSTTGYQGGTAQIILTSHAVQSGNTLTCTATPAAGSPCTPAGTFHWS